MLINVGNTGEMERAVAAFAQTPTGGLIATAGPLTVVHRNLITGLAARSKIFRFSPETFRNRRRLDLLWT